MQRTRLIWTIAAIFLSTEAKSVGDSAPQQDGQFTFSVVQAGDLSGAHFIKAPATTLVTCADLNASKVALPIAWNEAGAVIATKEVDTGSVSGVPLFRRDVECSGTTQIGTVQQVSYQIEDEKPGRNFRVYDADLGWSDTINVTKAEYLIPDGGTPKSGFTVAGISVNTGWLGSLFVGASTPESSWNVTPKERTSVKIVSDPDGADVWYEGVLLQKYPTTYTGSLATAFLNSLVIKKSGYRDCGAADQRPGAQDVLKHFDQIIFCKLVATRH
jgi:hypothetical protein